MLVTIHGHFYQPPRENPWTGEVPRQESAAPFHDWNERITDECYGPNGRSRVLDPQGRITAIVNNFSEISFDFGPTLLSDLARRFPYVYRRILAADRESTARHQGHGNAMAQAYNHMILPLATYQDKWTQVRWGLRDFEFRFGRKSEGLWLPETACDAETIEVVADAGVRFVILAPGQALRYRKIGEREWTTLSRENPLDVSRPYRCLVNGLRDQQSRHLDVFFYDGGLAAAISFEHLLRSAENLAGRLQVAGRNFGPDGLVHVATDGEVYGHHEPFADMCLAYLLRHDGPQRGLRFVNYPEHLAMSPPEYEVELNFTETGEGSAWSCAHGVGRWIRDCGCSTGGKGGWNQRWRTPLRRGLDAIREQIQSAFLTQTSPYLKDPWSTRDEYIEVLLRPEEGTRANFLHRHLRAPVDPATQQMIWSLLEATHQGMLMYTSCAWFFADISGLEVQQNLAYAARAMELAQPFVKTPLEPLLLRHLGQARSNLPERGNGADVYRKIILSRRLGPEHAAAQAAFEAAALGSPLDRRVSRYRVQGNLDPQVADADGEVSGQISVTDPAVEQSWSWSFHVSRGELSEQAVTLNSVGPSGAGVPPVSACFRLRDLWQETRESIARAALGQTLHDEIDQIRNLYREARAPMELLLSLDLPVPEVHRTLGGTVLSDRFLELARGASASPASLPDPWWAEVKQALEEDTRFSLNSDTGPLARALEDRINALLDLALFDSDPTEALRTISLAYETLARADRLQLPMIRTGLEPRTYDLVLRFGDELRTLTEEEGEPCASGPEPCFGPSALRHLAGHANLQLETILKGLPHPAGTASVPSLTGGKRANA